MSTNAATQSRPITVGKWLTAIQAAMIGVLYLATYHSMFIPLVTEWYEHENFSYGFLIPFIGAYLLWERRDAFCEPYSQPNRWGLVSLGSSLFLGIIGDAAGEPFLIRLSFVTGIVALIHLFWGSRCVRFVGFPLSYLFLMIPPPYPIVKQVSHFLRMFDAMLAETLIRAVGVPIYRDAYFLHLPNITLEVADICSGISSLFAMLSLGMLYVYYLPARTPAKATLLLGAVGFPMAANLFRIFLVGVSVYYYGPVMLGAFFHRFTGTFTFLLSLAMVLLLGEVCRRRYPVRSSADRRDTRQLLGGAHNLDPRDGSRSFSFAAGSAATMLAIVLAISLWSENRTWISLQPDLGQLSTSIGPYDAIASAGEDAYRDPKAEQVLSKVYQSSSAPLIEVFVGYRGRQFGDERLQSPKLVFPTGWEYASMDGVEIPLGRGESIHATWLLTRKGEARRVVLYWYRTLGRSFSSDLRNRMENIRGLIFLGRTDGAVVRLATPVGAFETAEQGKERLVSFAIRLHPELDRLMP